MALNKLKKWIGTQAMAAFFDQLNDNVDATNAAIDLAEQNSANISSVLAGGETDAATRQNGWTGVIRYKKNDLGRVSVWGRTTAGTVANGTIIATLPAGYRPEFTVAVPVYDRDSARAKVPFIIDDSGAITIRATDDNSIVSGRTVDFEISFNAV